MSDVFLTISSRSSGSYKEKNSKFLSFAIPVRSEEEVKQQVQLLKKKYFDARHICYAFVIGAKKDFYRAHDAGEPAHTAGDPILHAIRSLNLTNVMVVVVRYFGGTKLGVGGLISAYREAADEALKNATIQEDFEKEEFTLHFPYEQMNSVMKVLKEIEAEFLTQEFGQECQVRVLIRSTYKDRVALWVK